MQVWPICGGKVMLWWALIPQPILGILYRRWLGGMPPTDLPLGRTLKVVGAMLLAWPSYLLCPWSWPVFGALMYLWFAVAHNNGGEEGKGGWKRYGPFGLGYRIGYLNKERIPNWPPFLNKEGWTEFGEVWLGGTSYFFFTLVCLVVYDWEAVWLRISRLINLS
jgi:hypothetical protein